jgi:undecaprenyl diphosphate synthase
MAPVPLSNIPRHVAIVMDGNGRWAAKRFLPRIAGHKQGVTALRHCVEACIARGISVLTVFAFSSENWNRPPEEVSGLMELLVLSVSSEVPELQKNGVQVHFVGDRDRLSDKLRAALSSAESKTASNATLVLNVCFNYGGRWDIAQAARQLADAGKPITEIALDRSLALAHVPDPDLLIRTGGELRISNFLLWQAAYAELYFTEKLWPEFDAAALDEALSFFQSRERRFGQTSAQLASASGAPAQPDSDPPMRAA